MSHIIEMPSMRERVSRLILGGVLALGIGASTVAAPMSALAETGSVTINAVQGNDVKYNAYKVFTADVTEQGKAQHIEWASTKAKNAVEGVLAQMTPAYTGTTAQDALEYINANWGTSSDTRIVEDTDFANKLADALDGITAAGEVTAGTAATFDEGWYLFVTQPGTLGTGEMGTSAIFAAVNKDQAVSITEKTSLPTVNKEVKEDSGGQEAVAESWSYNGQDFDNEEAALQAQADDNSAHGDVVHNPGSAAVSEWGKHADANRGQSMDYRLTGTVAKNVESFESYYYQFEDDMTGIELTSLDDVVVKIDGTTVASGFEKSFENGKLLVTFDDLQSCKADATDENYIPITDATQVVVEYKAKLNANAAIGSAGNPNEVKINYSNNPNSTSKGSTVVVQNKLYTYQLELLKVDKDNVATTLAGAKFTIQVKAGAPDGNGGKYVQADGSLGTTAYEFTTDGSGKFSVAGLDEGTYIIHETTPPTGYSAWDADIELVIDSTFTNEGAFDTLTATLSGGEGDAETKVETIDPATGKISVKATDDKELDMPVTGQQGVMLVTLVGVGIVAISVAGLYRNRRKSDSGESISD